MKKITELKFTNSNGIKCVISPDVEIAGCGLLWNLSERDKLDKRQQQMLRDMHNIVGTFIHKLQKEQRGGKMLIRL